MYLMNEEMEELNVQVVYWKNGRGPGNPIS